MSTPLNELRDLQKSEFDLLVKVLKVFERDEYNLELRIKDLSNEMWFITVPKIKFGTLAEGQVIRIRSVKVNYTSKRNIVETKPSTNILRFTAQNAIVAEMLEKVEQENEKDKMMIDDDSEVIMSPVLYTRITDTNAGKYPLFRLDDLFLNYDEIPLKIRKENKFRVRFYVLRVDPQDAREVV